MPAVQDGEETLEQLRAELQSKREQRRERLSTMDAGTKDQLQDVGVAARDGVVVLRSSPSSLGTAWAVDEGHLLTVAHNVSGRDQEVTCWSLTGDEFEASVVDFVASQTPDVALLETDRTLSPLPTGEAASLVEDDPLLEIGHPASFGYWVLSAGPFLDHRREHAFATEVPILIGNSGSPVLDADGDVVGISSFATIHDEQRDAWGSPFRDGEVLHEPVRPRITTFHVPIEDALDKMEEWT